MHIFKLSLSIIAIIFSLSCSVNPVTGERELTLMSTAQQIAMGEKNYGPYQQQQGGRYVIDPEINLYLNSVGKRLAAVSDQPGLPYEFVLLNNDTPNAWALPGGKIAINRGLLTLLEDEAQLAAVLSHEIVHAAAGHSAQQMTRQTLLGLGAAALTGLSEQTEYGGLISQGAALGAGLANAKYGRDDELESDEVGIRYMIKAGYNPQAAVELQQKFVALSEGHSQDFMATLFASHPPSQQRVNKNTVLAANQGGERHQKRFEQELVQLRKDANAYKAHQQAISAANNKDLSQALTLARTAIKAQPAEALFYITEGQLLAAQNKTSQALQSFVKATQKNPDYVMGHLYRGMTEKKLNKSDAAIGSLEKSMGLLATPSASYYLGELMLQKNQSEKALQYFNFAAQDQGAIGEQARAQLAKLQPSTPAQ